MPIRIAYRDRMLTSGGPFTQVREWVTPGAQVHRRLVRTERGDSAACGGSV